MKANARAARSAARRDAFGVLDDGARRKLRKRRQPRWTAPMLATLTREPFSDSDWLYERKLDGVRCLVFRKGTSVRLMSRNRKTLNTTYPGRLQRLRRTSCPFDETPREKGAHWVSPRLVAEVEFTEWTKDGKLRHPRFLGLRSDKNPKRVSRERPRPAPGRRRKGA